MPHRFASSAPAFPSALALALALAQVLMLVASPVHAQTRGDGTASTGDPAIPSPELFLTDGSRIVQQYVAGNNLFVGADRLSPGSTYTIELRDAAGTPIDTATATADATGWLAPTRLWADVVVGCDAGTALTLAPYRYFDYESAENELDGRQLVVRIRDAAGQTVAETILPAIADRQTPRLYFAREDRCPIFEYQDGQQVHIAALHLPTLEILTADLYLVDSEEEACTEDSGQIEDIRPLFQGTGQAVTFDSSGEAGETLVDPLFPTSKVPPCTYIVIDDLASIPFPQGSTGSTLVGGGLDDAAPLVYLAQPLKGRPGTHTPNECPPCEEY